MATPSTSAQSLVPDGSSVTSRINKNTASYAVYVRIKPLDVVHPSNALSQNYSATDTTITVTENSKKHELHQSIFKFAKVFSPMVSQTEIYTSVVETPLRNFFDGVDSLIFSYGTSSSGKTHTMQGTPSNPGLIPRVLRTIYESVSGKLESDHLLAPFGSSSAYMLSKPDVDRIKKEKQLLLDSLTAPSHADCDMTLSGIPPADILPSLGDVQVLPSGITDDEICALWVSFYEVYNEQVFDLLKLNLGRKPQPLKIVRDEEDQSYYPSGLNYLPAASWEEAYNLYRCGKKNLHVSSTMFNRKSSRSHCIFTIKLLARPASGATNYFPLISFSICDLAGTERMMAHGDTKTGGSFEEMKSINKSLLALNKCFLTLKSHSNNVLPPFRDSSLTKLIKKFLVGQGKLSMIATVSQSAELLPQTLQILKMTSVAHTTKVIVKDPPSARPMMSPMPLRRFSTNYQREGGNRPVLNQVARDNIQNPNRTLEDLAQQIAQLTTEKEALEQWKAKAIEDSVLKQKEYDSLKESHSRQQRHIAKLEGNLGIAESSEESLYRKNIELTQELSERSRRDFEEIVKLQSDFIQTRLELSKVLQGIKDLFRIDSDIPMQVVERMAFLVKDMRTAATEEIAELTEELEKCKDELSSSTEMVATLTSRVNELEEELANRLIEPAKVETTSVDDTLSEMEENDYLKVCTKRRERHTTGRIGNDESVISIRGIKTSTKKRRTKKVSLTSEEAALQSESQAGRRGLRRNPRRRLLGEVDCLPDDFVSNDPVSPKVQLSPGSAIESLRRPLRRK